MDDVIRVTEALRARGVHVRRVPEQLMDEFFRTYSVLASAREIASAAERLRKQSRLRRWRSNEAFQAHEPRTP